MRTLSEISQALAVIEGELQRLDARRTGLLAQVAGLKQEEAAVLEAQAVGDSLPGRLTGRRVSVERKSELGSQRQLGAPS